MFNMGLGEILVVVAVALVFVGPTKLPEIARTVGRSLGRLRRATDEVRDTIQSEINSLEREEIQKKIAADKAGGVGPYSGVDPDIQEAAPQPAAAPVAEAEAEAEAGAGAEGKRSTTTTTTTTTTEAEADADAVAGAGAEAATAPADKKTT